MNTQESKKKSSWIGLILLSIFILISGSMACGDGNHDDCQAGNSNCEAECGNGVQEEGEACDDGNQQDEDGCNIECQLDPEPYCGDGTLDLDEGEECDFAIPWWGDKYLGPCDEFCQLEPVIPECGNGVVEEGEACDDGNTDETDECNNSCEMGSPLCGNGQLDPNESCDDRNTADNDGCSSSCQLEFCGDKIVQPGEECDDGDTDEHNGCTSLCEVSLCGNGVIETGETCDDGNSSDDDDCSSQCYVNMSSVMLGAGQEHTCAVYGTKIFCWGKGASGRLGYGNTENLGDNEWLYEHEGIQLGDQFKGHIADISLANANSCVIAYHNTFNNIEVVTQCWGEGVYTGYNNVSNFGDNEALATREFLAPFDNMTLPDQIDSGDAHTCVAPTQDLGLPYMYCWGEGADGRLGYNGTEDRDIEPEATRVPLYQANGSTPAEVRGVATGGRHTCAIIEDGGRKLKCWGYGGAGALGYGNSNSIGDNESINSVGYVYVDLDMSKDVVSVTAGKSHTCALLSGGSVKCWGSNTYGQLGYSGLASIGTVNTPAAYFPVPLAGKAEVISAGDYHTCALLETGGVQCWGQNNQGQLGLGHKNNIGDDEDPVVAGLVDLGLVEVLDIQAGGAHTCVRTAEAKIRCWGDGASGQLGYGNVDDIGDDETPAQYYLNVLGTEGNVPIFK